MRRALGRRVSRSYRRMSSPPFAEVARIPAARLVDRLEELSLVKRHTDPEDRRGCD
jgi:hypothetical protein